MNPTEHPTQTSGPTSKARRTLTGVAVAVAVAFGGLAIAAINPLGSAGAQTADSTTTTVAGGQKAPRAHAARAATTKVLDDALATLVKDGTLTQAQADAVRAQVKTTAQQERGQLKAKRTDRRQEMLGTAASTLGVTTDQLTGDIRSGKTLAEVAKDQGVDVSKVTQALTADAGELIDQAVTAGRIDQARADTMKQKAAERIERFVTEGGRRR